MRTNWFKRELQSEKVCFHRKQLVDFLWHQYVKNPEFTSDEILLRFANLKGFLGHSIPVGYSGDREKYARIIQQNFITAIKTGNYNLFSRLFQPLTLNELLMINKGEQLGLKIPECLLPPISRKSIHLLEEYLEDAAYSVSLSILSQNTRYTVASKGMSPDLPLNMFSVGKIFTGVLILEMVRTGFIDEKDLQQPIQLNKEVLQSLPAQIREQLKFVTLYQIMTHKAGLGDYLYQFMDRVKSNSHTEIKIARDFASLCDPSFNLVWTNAISLEEKCRPFCYYLEKNHDEWKVIYLDSEMKKIPVDIMMIPGLKNALQTLPKKPRCELNEDDLYTVYKSLTQHFYHMQAGKYRYSNVGILLIGFAIEHAFHQKTGQRKQYEEILREFIIDPVQMKIFSSRMPTDARYNLSDAFAPHMVGTPAGCYWTTAKDLQQFGTWLIKKCHNQADFLRLLESYGGEFYCPEKKEIAHAGDMPSASAFLICSLNNNTSVAILSDQGRVGAKLARTLIEQSTLDNMQSMGSLISSNSVFFKKIEDQYLIEHRHENAFIQGEYDKRFALIPF